MSGVCRLTATPKQMMKDDPKSTHMSRRRMKMSHLRCDNAAKQQAVSGLDVGKGHVRTKRRPGCVGNSGWLQSNS